MCSNELSENDNRRYKSVQKDKAFETWHNKLKYVRVGKKIKNSQ